MQYSPKLKMAAEEIKAVLAKYDIGGIVMLHTPGYSEFVNKVDPSYSCCTLSPAGELRIRAKLADFNGDKGAWKKATTDSVEMLHAFTTVLMENIILPMFKLSDQVNKQVGAEFKDLGGSSHTTQNN